MRGIHVWTREAGDWVYLKLGPQISFSGGGCSSSHFLLLTSFSQEKWPTRTWKTCIQHLYNKWRQEVQKMACEGHCSSLAPSPPAVGSSLWEALSADKGAQGHFLGQLASNDWSMRGMKSWPPHSNPGQPSSELSIELAKAFIETISEPNFSLCPILLP